jgi:transcriptional regulator with XRE-family HTH domain
MNPLKQEFIRLFRESGWKQAEIARQLEMTRGGVNGIITGKTVPSHATLKLFQLLLLAKKPEVMAAHKSDRKVKEALPRREEWAEDLLEALRQVTPRHRADLLDALQAVVRAFPHRKIRCNQ